VAGSRPRGEGRTGEKKSNWGRERSAERREKKQTTGQKGTRSITSKAHNPRVTGEKKKGGVNELDVKVAWPFRHHIEIMSAAGRVHGRGGGAFGVLDERASGKAGTQHKA